MNKQIEALKMAIEALEWLRMRSPIIYEETEAEKFCKETLESEDSKCNPHPKAPHGFNRDASHSVGDYVCDCEGWDAWQDGYEEGLRKGLALAEAEKQEPVAEVYETEDGWEKVYIGTMLVRGIPNGTKLYTHPATWQSLGDDEIEYLECLKAPPVHPDFINDDSWYEFARAIEQALKEKNHGSS